MASTYYSQLLHEYYWDKISASMDTAVEEYREAEESVRAFDDFTAHSTGISVWVGKDSYTEDGSLKTMVYIGSVMSLSPSGKFYMPWSTNVTQKEAEKDTAYWTAFERVTDKFNMSVENGEGDPTDVFLVKYYEEEDAS